MKKYTAILLLALAGLLSPSLSFAKGVPLFFQTGDEIFELEGAPDFGEGFALGYACKHFGLFWADVWTWDCKMMAVNQGSFSAADLDAKALAEYSSKFSMSDAKRSFWNHYGFLSVLLALMAIGGFKLLFSARRQ